MIKEIYPVTHRIVKWSCKYLCQLSVISNKPLSLEKNVMFLMSYEHYSDSFVQPSGSCLCADYQYTNPETAHQMCS